MPEETRETVDGFSDNTTEQKLPSDGEGGDTPGSADRSLGADRKPLSAEEYARMKKEAGEEDAPKRDEN